MYKNILIGFDGSNPAQIAFDHGLSLAKRYGAQLYVLTVVRPPEFGVELEMQAVVQNARKHYQRMLEPLKELAKDQGVAIECYLVVGHPAECIVSEAEQRDINLIVVGHRGQGLAGRWLLGSVAKQVMHHAACTVMVVR